MNQPTPTAFTDATRLIIKDHAQALAQFHRLSPDTPEALRRHALRSLCTALEIHAQLEEELFYPALQAAGLSSQTLTNSLPEHDEMRRLIERLRGETTAGSTQDDAINALMNCVMHHVADEETELLPAARRQLGSERLREIGAQMTARRADLLKQRTAGAAGNGAAAVPAGTAVVAVGALVAGSMLVRALRRSTRSMRT